MILPLQLSRRWPPMAQAMADPNNPKTATGTDACIGLYKGNISYRGNIGLYIWVIFGLCWGYHPQNDWGSLFPGGFVSQFREEMFVLAFNSLQSLSV